MQPHLSYHLERIIMPELTINDKIEDLDGLANLLQQPLDVCLDKTQRRTERHLATMTILAAFGAPSQATGLLLRRRLPRSLAGLTLSRDKLRKHSPGTAFP